MGNFTLSVMFHSYVNPNSLCGECRLPEYGTGPVCCETFNQTDNCSSLCKFRFVFSIESHGEPLKYISLIPRHPDYQSDNITAFPVGLNTFNVSNVSNPIKVQLTTWTVSVMCFYKYFLLLVNNLTRMKLNTIKCCGYERLIKLFFLIK